LIVGNRVARPLSAELRVRDASSAPRPIRRWAGPGRSIEGLGERDGVVALGRSVGVVFLMRRVGYPERRVDAEMLKKIGLVQRYDDEF